MTRDRSPAARPVAAGLLMAILALAAPSGVAEGREASRKARPNIVIILVDTLRADRLPFYGYRKNTASFLADLAASSAVFDRALSTSSKTAPATASLFSSVYPDHHGVVLGRLVTEMLVAEGGGEITLNRIPAPVDTLGEVMKRAGYSTWAISDNYNVSKETGFAQGFDRFRSDRDFDKGAEHINGVLSEWRREMQRSEPYLLYVHYMEPHHPYELHEKWYSFDPSEIRRTSFDGKPIIPVTARSRAEDSARYDSEIGFVDEMISRMYRLFEWDRNTLLVFTSDHGEEFWEHGDIGHGQTLFEEVLHVPLLFHDSTGRIPASRIATPVSLVDVLPTLADYAGGEQRGFRHGRSLLPLLESRGRGAWTPRVLFAQVESFQYLFYESLHRNLLGHFVVRAVLDGRWKLVDDSRSAPSLHHLDEDPGELVNLIEQRPEVASRLQGILSRYVDSAKAFNPESFRQELSKEDVEKLRTLGYVE